MDEITASLKDVAPILRGKTTNLPPASLRFIKLFTGENPDQFYVGYLAACTRDEVLAQNPKIQMSGVIGEILEQRLSDVVPLLKKDFRPAAVRKFPKATRDLVEAIAGAGDELNPNAIAVAAPKALEAILNRASIRAQPHGCNT